MKYFLVGKLIGIIYRFYALTFRYRLHFTANSFDICELKKYLSRAKLDQPILFAIWHQDEMSAIPFFQDSGCTIMVSTSKDGDILAGALESFGLSSVRGSSNRNAVSVLINSLKLINKGQSMAIAVDGPKGPLHEVKEGVVKISEKTQVPILPIKAIPHKCICFEKSWSKSKLPLPFSKIDLIFGERKLYTKSQLQESLQNLAV